MEKERLGTKQLAVLVIFYVIGDMLLFLPTNITGVAHQDSWISALIGIPIGLGIAWFILKYSQCFQGLTLVEFHKLVLGKWVGGIVTLLYLFAFFNNSVTQIREIGDFVSTQMMTETPIRVISLLMVIVFIYAIRSGLESIARTAELLIIVFAIVFIAIILLLVPQIQPLKLTPVLAVGMPSIVHGVLYFITFPFCEMYVFLMIFPSVVQSKYLRRDYLLAASIAGIGIFSIVLISLLVLGPYLTEHQMYSTYTLAKKISVGHFLERVEAILAVNWILSTYFRMIIYGYAFILGVAQLFNLRDYRSLTIPLGTMAFGYAIILTPNIVFFNYTNPYWITWDFTYFPVIPLIVYAVYKIKLRMNVTHQ